MTAVRHFGCPKLTFDHISVHFIYFCFFLILLKWLPFWMFQNHFRSHLWPFQINMRMSEIHFRSHFCPFQIDTQLVFYIFDKMAAVGHFGCPKLIFDRISGHFRLIWIFFL